MKHLLRSQSLGILLLLAPLFAAGVYGATVRKRLIIVSLNMHGELDSGKVLGEFNRYERIRHADILLLQEVEGDQGKCREFAGGLSRSMSLPFVHMPEEALSTGSGDGLVVISRFRLKETAMIPLMRFDLVVRSRHRIALAQTVETPLGDIRLFNLHLDSRINPEQRLEQLSAVLAAADPGSGPVIIGGDFNTGDFRWIAHVLPIPEKRNQRDALLKRMAESGFQTPFESTGPTYDQLGMQLDWIFFRKLRSLAAGTQPIDFSDHRAIWTEIGLP
jgi:endonuclease/exonuclease/phosphatase family metal-dependent hydrolase